MSENSGIQETEVTVMNFNVIARDRNEKIGEARVLDALEKFLKFTESLKQFGLEVEWNYNVAKVPQVGPVVFAPTMLMPEDHVGYTPGGYADPYPNARGSSGRLKF